MILLPLWRGGRKRGYTSFIKFVQPICKFNLAYYVLILVFLLFCFALLRVAPVIYYSNLNYVYETEVLLPKYKMQKMRTKVIFLKQQCHKYAINNKNSVCNKSVNTKTQ